MFGAEIARCSDCLTVIMIATPSTSVLSYECLPRYFLFLFLVLGTDLTVAKPSMSTPLWLAAARTLEPHLAIQVAETFDGFGNLVDTTDKANRRAAASTPVLFVRSLKSRWM